MSKEKRTGIQRRTPPVLTGEDRDRFITREKLNDLKRMFFLSTLPKMLRKWKDYFFEATVEEVKMICLAYEEILQKQAELDKIELPANFASRKEQDEFSDYLKLSVECWSYGKYKVEPTEIRGLYKAWVVDCKNREAKIPAWSIAIH